jgi:uncharacterized protein YecE (DUF72 family)
MANNWNKRTPENFKFAVKFPKVITHDKRLNDVEKDIEQFYEAMEQLYDKILVFLIQLPPSLQIAERLDLIKNLRYQLDPSFRYVIEVRHHSWFNELFYNVLKERNYCLVWSQQDILITPPISTTDFVYLRLIGDRSINERDFGKINKDRTKEMQLWINKLKNIKTNEKSIKNAIISANNHYAGFGPMTAKLFSEMMNLKDHVRPFPILDYKISSNETTILENERNYRIYKQSSYRTKTRQTDISEFFK